LRKIGVNIVNLLARSQKKAIENEIRFKLAFVVFVLIVFWASIFLVLEYSMILYLKIQIPALESSIETGKGTEASKDVRLVESDIESLNNMLSKIGLIQKGGIQNLPKLLKRIGEITPAGADLDQVIFSVNSISLAGIADFRSDVLEFKEMLENEDFCDNLNAPIVPLKEQDVKFTFNCSRLSK